MTPFDFQPRTRVVFGPDTIQQLGELAAGLGATRVMVVSDPGVVKAGHTAKGVQSLEAAGLYAAVFDSLQENPTTDQVDAGLSFANKHRPDLFVGLGGGSSMDCAKGVNFVYSNGGSIADYWGVGKATKPMLPMIAVPTTAGTGSEAQSFALISDAKTHVKMACGDAKAACKIAILDPVLTLTQPKSVTALTGIDAIAHTLETFVTTRRNAVSLAYSREAWRLLGPSFGRVLENPADLEARSAMQLGAAFAGFAIEYSMLGAAHALANPLTATYGIVHGQAVGMMLPHVVRFNGQEHAGWYCDLLQSTASMAGMPQPDAGVGGLADFLTGLVSQAGLATQLAAANVQQQNLPELAEAAAKQWTGNFNPRPVDPANLLSMYEAAY